VLFTVLLPILPVFILTLFLVYCISLQQALSRDPFNAQLIRAFRYCHNDGTTRFPSLVEGGIEEILALLPEEGDTDLAIVTRLQAVVKGALERTQLRLGVGARKENARPMAAKLGVVVQGHPMLLRVQASWMGKVTHIKVFDVSKGVAFKVKLRTPFAPTRETGAPRRLQLTMQVCKYPVASRNGRSAKRNSDDFSSLAVELVLKFTDQDSGHYSYRRMRLNLLALSPAMVGSVSQLALTETAAPQDSPPSPTQRQVHVGLEDVRLEEHRSLLDLPEHPSLYRALLPPGAVAAEGVSTLESPVVSVTAEGTFTSAGSPQLGAQSIAQGVVRGDSSIEEGDAPTQEDLVFSSLEEGMESCEDFGVVSVTNAHTVELVKEGFQWRGLYYLARVVNEHDVTQVTVTQLQSDRVFIFLMAREHIDRSQSLAKRWAMLMQVLEYNPAARPLLRPVRDPSAPIALVSENFSLLEGPSEMQLGPTRVSSEHKQNPLGLSAAQHQAALNALGGQLTVCGLQVYTSLLPRGNGVSLILVDPRNMPIIGSGLEILDTVEYAPSSLSLIRSSAAEKFHSQQFPEAQPDIGTQAPLGYSDVEPVAAPGPGLGRQESDLEYGSAVHLLGDDEDGLGFDTSTREGSARFEGEGAGSAYELLGEAAAVRRPDGTVVALSPEEYEQMLLQQGRYLLRSEDSDMVGLRYGGALDDDSVSQVVLSRHPSAVSSPKDRHTRSPFELVHPDQAPVVVEQEAAAGESGQPSARATGSDKSTGSHSVTAMPTAAHMEAAALLALDEAVGYINRVAGHDGVSSLPVFSPKQPAPSVVGPAPASAADNRLVAARKSISLGQNLGAALSAALVAGGDARRASVATVPTAKHRPLNLEKPLAPLSMSQAHSKPRRSSLRRRSVVQSALIKVKAAAVSVVSTAIGSALLTATMALADDVSEADDIPEVAAPEVNVAQELAVGETSLGTIAEGEDDEVELGSDEEDWIAKLFRGAGLPTSADASDTKEAQQEAAVREAAFADEEIIYTDDAAGAEAGVEGEVGMEEMGGKLRTRTMTTATSDWSEGEEEVADTGVAAAVLADEVAVEWIVELGSSGAVDQVEEVLLEELVAEGVLRLAEMISDSIPGVRVPLLREAFAEATQSAAEFLVHSDRVAAEQLAEMLKFQAMCVALVQVGEAVAVRRAIKSIMAAERARELARRRQVNEEKARQAAALAAAQSTGAPVQTPVAPPPTLERKAYRPTATNESEEFLAALGGKGGYFVNKIRSQVFSADDEPKANGASPQKRRGVSIQEHLRSQTARRRLAAQRDTFTPDLPPSLRDASVRPRPHTDHAQHTATGPVSLTAPAAESHSHTPVPLVPSAFEQGDTMFAQSMVPLHITDDARDGAGKYGAEWEASEASLNNYFKLDDPEHHDAAAVGGQSIPVASRATRSAGAISHHNRQVNLSRRAQNRNRPTEGAPPLWLTLGGAGSASLLLPPGVDGMGSSIAYSALPGEATGTLPLPTGRDASAESLPFMSMINARAQSPAYPAAALPSFAFDTAEGLKQALQDNWDRRTMPKYWNTALKARVEERINEPFAVKSAAAKKQRRAIKVKSAFAAQAAAAAVNSTSEVRDHLDRQFTMLLSDDEQLHESFFESHMGPFGCADTPFQNSVRREDSVLQRAQQEEQLQLQRQQQEQAAQRQQRWQQSMWARGISGSGSASVNGTDAPEQRASTAPARPSLQRGDTMRSYNTLGSWDDSPAKEATCAASTAQRPTTAGVTSRQAAPFKVTLASTENSQSRDVDLAAAAPLVHSVRKGLQHDHDYDDSHLLSNQVEPPFHNLTTRLACRSPPDLSLHFKRSTAAIAEEIDEAAEREEVDEMFRKSLEIFHKVGYVTKRPLPHATHWVNVVSVYLASLKSIDELRKRLATLGRTSPRALTTEEAVCVLSDAKGIVGQAVEKLKHLEYYAEIRLVCRSIHVRNMVLLLEGGEKVYTYRVGDQRAPRPIAFVDPEEEEFQREGISRGSMLPHGMDGSALRDAGRVVDPYSPEMVLQHREVQAHRKIRKQWEEMKGVSSKGQSTKHHAEDWAGGGAVSSKFNPTLDMHGSFATMNDASETAEALSTTEEAVHELAAKGLFVSAVQPKLHHDSKFVRSRASMVTLQPAQPHGVGVGSFVSQASLGADSVHNSSDQDVAPVMARAGLRASLSMTVSSPKRVSMLVNNIGAPHMNRHGSMASMRASTAGKGVSLLGAIAAAVAAADRADGSAPVRATTVDEGSEGRDGEGGSAWRNLRGSLAPLDTGLPRVSKRSSIRLSKRVWRMNSGLFDQPAPNSAQAAMQQAAARVSNPASTPQSHRSGATPKRTGRSPTRLRTPKTPNTATSGSPKPAKWKVRSDGGRLVLEEDHTEEQPVRTMFTFDTVDTGSQGAWDDAQAGDEGFEDSLVEGLEEGDEQEEDGEDEEEEEELVEVVSPPPVLRPQVSINPWYLKQQNQQQQLQKQLSITSAQARTVAPSLTSPLSKPASPANNSKPRAGAPGPGMLQRERSYRTANVVSEIFEREAVGVPFAVMSRRDAERATKDETVAKSDKQYIRQGVELRALRYQH
jgi:hypothetical protein